MEDERKKPRVVQRKLMEMGGSLVMAIPKAWVEQHHLEKGEEVSIVLNGDLKVLSPHTEKLLYGILAQQVAKEV